MTAVPPPRSTTVPAASGTIGAEGVGLATVTTAGVVLDTWFPHPWQAHPSTCGTERLSPDRATTALGADILPLLGIDPARDVEIIAVHTRIARLADAPVDTHDTYLRLHLLSRHLVDPDGATLRCAVELLPTVGWTNYGACAVDGFDTIRARLRTRGPVMVHRVDRLPRLLDYTLPSDTPPRRRRRPVLQSCTAGLDGGLSWEGPGPVW